MSGRRDRLFKLTSENLYCSLLQSDICTNGKRKADGAESISRLSPAFCRTRRPGASTVHRALRLLVFGARSSVAIAAQLCTMRLVALCRKVAPQMGYRVMQPGNAPPDALEAHRTRSARTARHCDPDCM